MDGSEPSWRRPKWGPSRFWPAVRGAVPTACPELGGWLGDFDPAGRRRAIQALRRQLDGIAALGGRGVIAPAAWGMFTLRLPPFDAIGFPLAALWP